MVLLTCSILVLSSSRQPTISADDILPDEKEARVPNCSMAYMADM